MQTTDTPSSCSAILAPLRVSDSHTLKWDEQCDVLVIGWGRRVPVPPSKPGPMVSMC